MNIVKKIKADLLTRLFIEWVKEEKDVEALELSSKLIGEDR